MGVMEEMLVILAEEDMGVAEEEIISILLELRMEEVEEDMEVMEETVAEEDMV